MSYFTSVCFHFSSKKIRKATFPYAFLIQLTTCYTVSLQVLMLLYIKYGTVAEEVVTIDRITVATIACWTDSSSEAVSATT